MSNELINIPQGDLVTIIGEHGVTDLIKPLVKEIELFETYVAGTSYVSQEVLSALKVGDKLILRREKDNRFDEQAILLLDEKEQKVGYVPEKDNTVFARLMDAGKLLTAKVKEVTWKGSYAKVTATIYLVDF